MEMRRLEKINTPQHWQGLEELAERESRILYVYRGCRLVRIVRSSIYTQLEGDILFAQQDYAGALAAYEKVNASNIASPATFFSAAKTKELLKADPKEVIVLMGGTFVMSVLKNNLGIQ